MTRSELTKRLDLLIVEDDPSVQRAERRCLEKHWKSVTFANDASDGLRAIETDLFDLVLSDWDCPNGGGQRVLENSSIPVVIHTGNSEVKSLYPQSRVVMKPSRSDIINNALLDAYLGMNIG